MPIPRYRPTDDSSTFILNVEGQFVLYKDYASIVTAVTLLLDSLPVEAQHVPQGRIFKGFLLDAPTARKLKDLLDGNLS